MLNFFRPSSDARSRGASLYGLLVASVLIYAAVWAAWSALHGYGFDDDAYSTVRVWQQLLAQHVYVPSRFQGGVVAELPLGLAAWLLGSGGSNACVIVCTLVSIVALERTLAHYGLPHRWLVIAVMMSNGVVLIASATSMDYMVAFAVFTLGFYALAVRADVAGVVLLGASAGARIFYVTLAELTIVFVLLERADLRGAAAAKRLAEYMGCGFFVAGLFYLPVWFNHGLGFDWLSAARPTDQGLVGLLIRFLYKTVMFVGLPGVVCAAIGWAFIDRMKLRRAADGAQGRTTNAFRLYAAAFVALHLALFLWIPSDPSYLIPALPLAAALAATLCGPATLAGWAIGQLVTTLVVFDPLTVGHPARDLCGRSHAMSVRLAPRVLPGLLIEDAHRRRLAPLCGEQVLLFPPKIPTAPLPAGERGRLYPPTAPINIAPDW